jgi:hypothetical protein
LAGFVHNAIVNANAHVAFLIFHITQSFFSTLSSICLPFFPSKFAIFSFLTYKILSLLLENFIYFSRFIIVF